MTLSLTNYLKNNPVSAGGDLAPIKRMCLLSQTKHPTRGISTLTKFILKKQEMNF
jgi:hypothetical protein